MGPNDVGTPLHRDMGVHHAGRRAVEDLRAVHGTRGGPTRGRDGNVHMAVPSLGLHPMVSHLPAMLPVAAGMALAFKIGATRRVAVGCSGKAPRREGTRTRA